VFGVRRIQMGELNCPGRNLGVRGDRARLCDGEDWFLQLDSHHRFVPDRDVLLLDEAARSTSDRPVVATSGTPVLRGRISPRRPPADDHVVHRIQSTRHALVHGEPH
jgi:Glycosyltransferase (GlcNAc)